MVATSPSGSRNNLSVHQFSNKSFYSRSGPMNTVSKHPTQRIISLFRVHIEEDTVPHPVGSREKRSEDLARSENGRENKLSLVR